jgi:hypothetical protein
MLFRYMHVLRARAALPNLTLWRIGARTGVSDTYSRVLDYEEKVLCKGDTYDRTMLTILTSRAFLRGKLIAENAARGVFQAIMSAQIRDVKCSGLFHPYRGLQLYSYNPIEF